MAFYDENTRETYCAEDCRASIYYPKNSINPTGWVVEVEQEGYYDEPAILWDVKCCPKCMRRLLPDGGTMLPDTWKEEK